MPDFHSLLEDSERVDTPTITINEKDMTKELAYHEASHFVIQRLVHKLNLNFVEADTIIINVAKRTGCISGFGANALKKPNKTLSENCIDKIKEKFYTEQPIRVFSDCLTLMAGYYSYKHFIDDSEYFISKVDECNNPNKKTMWSIEYVCESNITDFKHIRNRLEYLNVYKKEQIVEYCRLFCEDLQEIMSHKTVFCSIGYVKNYLIKHEGKILETKHIKVEVDRWLKKVDIIKALLNKYITTC